MSAGGDNSHFPPSPKKARMSPSPPSSSWLPSCDTDATSHGEQESCASVDSGLSDSATPPHDSATPPVLPPSTQDMPEVEGVDRDDLSSLSGLSDMSGQEWKPDMSGKLAWLHRAMARGEDPRGILIDMLPGGSEIPEGIDTMTLWKVLFNLLSEPPKRSKLSTVNTLEDCVDLIKGCSNIVILTGAGVSVSCGIPDFRSKDGVYARLAQDFPDLPDPQAMFDIHYFRKDPRPFFKFAREIYPGQFQPSPCHRFIRAVESEGKLLRNYTQNIDTLEQVAGIEKVIQCHGSFATASCMVCKVQVDAEVIRKDIFDQKIPLCQVCPKQDVEALLSGMTGCHKTDTAVPVASLSPKISDPSPVASSSNTSIDTPTPSTSTAVPSPGPTTSAAEPQDSLFSTVPVMKPDIVFFGEGLPDHFHNSITRDKSCCDLLIVIGSSLKVRPVALIPSSLPPEVPQILINREPLPHCTFDVELLGDCDSIINQLCLMLGEGWASPVHRARLEQHMGLPVEYCKSREEAAGDTSKEEEDEQEGKSEEKVNSVEKGDETNNLGEPSKPSTDMSQEDTVIPEDATADSDTEFDDGLKPEPSLAEFIQDDQFLFLPPARYVFTGAEVYPDTSDDEIDDDDELDGQSDPPADSSDQLEAIETPEPQPLNSGDEEA
eukprot:GFUD01039186.1.p1 GENE.GFUD01039186.1~~GFUD01039186.1.p1  ORF type:complete len:660 (-),score=191.77 GFUD01039186.1:211-2190(-)